MTSIYLLAKDALSDTDGLAEDAVDRLFQRLHNDAALLRSVASVAVLACVKTNVGAVIRNDRGEIVERATVPIDSRERIAALGAAIRQSLLDFPMPGGLPLRHAMREQIEECATFYGKQASTMSLRSRWLGMVAKQVPEGVTAGEVLSDTDALRLYHNASLEEPMIQRNPVLRPSSAGRRRSTDRSRPNKEANAAAPPL